MTWLLQHRRVKGRSRLRIGAVTPGCSYPCAARVQVRQLPRELPGEYDRKGGQERGILHVRTPGQRVS